MYASAAYRLRMLGTGLLAAGATGLLAVFIVGGDLGLAIDQAQYDGLSSAQQQMTEHYLSIGGAHLATLAVLFAIVALAGAAALTASYRRAKSGRN